MRRDLVTRTIVGTKATVTIVDKDTKAMSTKEVALSKVFEDDAKLTKAVAKQLAENEILISVDASEKVEKCYGLPIADFMANAIELDPKTREELNK